jgi:two-component system CheB/CheR fusion protein
MNLISADIGRPVAHLRAYVDIPNFDKMIAEVINSVSAKSAEIKSADGESYLMRIAPYKTGDHAIRGAVVEFIRHKVEDRPSTE